MQFSIDLTSSSGSCSCQLETGQRASVHYGAGIEIPRVRMDLLEFLLMDSHDIPGFAEDKEARRGGALINTADEDFIRARHAFPRVHAADDDWLKIAGRTRGAGQGVMGRAMTRSRKGVVMNVLQDAPMT